MSIFAMAKAMTLFPFPGIQEEGFSQTLFQLSWDHIAVHWDENKIKLATFWP